MRWAAAIAQSARLEDALDEALESISMDLAGETPDLILAFPSADYSPHFSLLAPAISARFPGVMVLGCSAGGVIGGGREIEEERALVLVAATLPGVELTMFQLSEEPTEWRDQLDLGRSGDPAFLILADPVSCPSEVLLRWMDSRYPGSMKLGGLASGGHGPGSTALFAGRAVAQAGAVGVAMTGNLEISGVVAQGCRPIGAPMFVTRAADNVIYELDGRPALAAIEALYGSLSTLDRELFRHSLFIGLVMNRDRQEYHQGDFLIRNILGVQPERGSLAVGTEVSERQVVQFHLRDADTSAADLEALLESYPGEPPAGALLFSCLGRGAGLYGHPDHDSSLFLARFGDVPLGGFFCNGEIGPVGNHTYVHGYTSCFALFSPRRTPATGNRDT